MRISSRLRTTLLASTLFWTSAPVVLAQTGNCSIWFDDESIYRFPLTVQESSGSLLQDFTVPLSLDTTTAVADGELNPDASDLRFYDSLGNRLPHWTESGVGSDDTRVWVRVGNISALETLEITAYYGKPDATDASSIHEAFLGGDDFESYAMGSILVDPWSLEAGNMVILNDGSSLALKSLSAAAPGYASFANESHKRYTVMASILDGDAESDAPQPGVIFARQDADNYDAVLLHSASQEVLQVRVRDGVWNEAQSAAATIASGHQEIEVRVDAAGMEGKATVLVNGIEAMSISDGLAGSDLGTGLIYSMDDGSAYAFWDNFRIRAYATADPTYSVGSKESRDCDEDGFLYNEDCDDSHADAHPGGVEVCDDGIDQDCSGSDLSCDDVDDDEDGYTENQGDCDDSKSEINPGVDDVCGDRIDQDCSGSDLSCDDVDDDGDGETENQGDCDDSDSGIYSDADEVCDDGVDQDCTDGDLSCDDVDDDGDGVSENAGDCNDADSSIRPGATDVCEDGIDQDCDGEDATCPEDTPTEDEQSTDSSSCSCDLKQPATRPSGAILLFGIALLFLRSSRE